MKIFKDNPKLDVVYKTSDNTYFYTEGDAKAYARGLENKQVDKLVRESNPTINSDTTSVLENINTEEEQIKVSEKTNKPFVPPTFNNKSHKKN